jgi:hypothetical protein
MISLRFDETVEKLISEGASTGNKKLFVLITGEIVPETGKSWCPDCVVADPVIHKVRTRADQFFIRNI